MNEKNSSTNEVNVTNEDDLEKDITEEQVKFLSKLFSQTPKKIWTWSWERIIYDIATQYFVFGSTNISIYWSFDFKPLINTIVKEARWDFLDITEIWDQQIDEFRKYFYRHPVFLEALFSIVAEWWEFRMFNNFLKYTIEFKILQDIDLNPIREIRTFLYKQSSATDYTGDLFSDLWNFLKFDRFLREWWVAKDELDDLIRNMCVDIKSWNMISPLEYKSYKDRNQFPDTYLNAIEKIVLKTYTYDPLTHLQKTETCRAIDKLNLKKLKDNIWFNPRWWQRRSLVFESRENLAANCRRTGKSLLATYIAIRQIMLPQQLVLYILPNKEWFSEQPFFYIEKFFDNLKNKNDVEGNIPWLQFNNKTFKVVNKDLKSKILFISAQGGTKGGRSFSSNLIIMDEAGYNEDPDMYDVSYSSTTDTRWRMRAISTINKDIPINRFFYKKIDLDGELDSTVVVVDIYNNEFIPDDEKVKLEKKYKFKNQKIRLSEYMAIFIWQADSFDMSWFFKLDFNYDIVKFQDFAFKFTKSLDAYRSFVVCRDPGKSKDPWGIAIIWIKDRNTADIIMTWYFRHVNYILQADIIIEMFWFLSKMRKTEIVMDLGKVWSWLHDYMITKKIYAYGVNNTGGATITQVTSRIYNMPVNILEGNMKNLMNSSILTWFSRLDHIRNEFETYEASKTREWTNHHHDILSAIMIWGTIALERNRLSFRKEIVEPDHKEENGINVEELLMWIWKKQQATTSNFLY